MYLIQKIAWIYKQVTRIFDNYLSRDHNSDFFIAICFAAPLSPKGTRLRERYRATQAVNLINN